MNRNMARRRAANPGDRVAEVVHYTGRRWKGREGEVPVLIVTWHILSIGILVQQLVMKAGHQAHSAAEQRETL